MLTSGSKKPEEYTAVGLVIGTIAKYVKKK